MRIIVRKERPHPGAQLRITNSGGHRLTAFVTNATTGGPGTQLADLEPRHRRRARCEDRFRISKDTRLRALPLQGFAANQIWCQIVALAMEVTAWMQMLALTGHDARPWVILHMAISVNIAAVWLLVGPTGGPYQNHVAELLGVESVWLMTSSVLTLARSRRVERAVGGVEGAL